MIKTTQQYKSKKSETDKIKHNSKQTQDKKDKGKTLVNNPKQLKFYS